MVKQYVKYFYFILLSFSLQIGYGQSVSTRIGGSVRGIVKDSSTAIPLPQATLSVYRSRDSSIFKYQFNDARGRFLIEGLPIDTTFFVVISYVGYQQFSRELKITNETKDFNWGSINLILKTNLLQEVKIKIPPMVMRGDTIQFNADAFKLRPNAVVGDLLKQLPGVTIWGDGKITVNGKSVTQIMVDGKIFFSGDASVITDNLPKGIVDHIDVTPDRHSLEKDTTKNMGTLNMNVVLKKGKKAGIFGKIGYGRGTEKRHEAEGILNFFNPKTQISIAAGSNDINKSAVSINEMLLNSGYRIATINRNLIEPGFNQEGITKQRSGGISLNQFWVADLQTHFDYFLLDTKREIFNSRITTTVLGDSLLIRESSRSGFDKLLSNKFNVNQSVNVNKFNTFNIKANFEKAKSNTLYEESIKTSSSNQKILSISKNENVQDDDYHILYFSTIFNHSIDETNGRQSKEDLIINYNLKADAWSSEKRGLNTFHAVYENQDSINFNRQFF